MKRNRQWYAVRKTNRNARIKTIYLYAKLRGGVHTSSLFKPCARVLAQWKQAMKKRALWMHFCVCNPFPEIREQNVETRRNVSSFSTKIRDRGSAKAAAFHSISITAHAPSKRELGGHPVRKDRGECKCGPGANAPRCTWEGFKRSGRKTDADRYALCRAL